MKIVDERRIKIVTTFGEVSPGDIFEYRCRFYMKINHHEESDFNSIQFASELYGTVREQFYDYCIVNELKNCVLTIPKQT